MYVGFKPYYKWIIFNMYKVAPNGSYDIARVLNLIING